MTLFGPRDGLSQLTEIMTHEQEFAPPPIDPDRRKQSRRRGLIITAVVAVAILGLAGGYVAYALNAPIGPAEATSTIPDAAPGPAAAILLSPEGESAVSIAGAEEFMGSDPTATYLTAGGDAAMPIASISKLITAMVVLSAKPLASADDVGPTLTFGKADHALYDKYYVLGATIASMPTNSTMSERDALKMLLVPSASNYAEAVALWAFGSNGAFVNATKQWLADNALTSTTIVEPTGIDARNTSTPTDLMALARLAAAEPTIAAIAALPHLDIANYEQMLNTNDILGTGGVTGLKTGTLSDGSNLLFTANLPVGLPEPLTVVGVVLGGYSHESVNLDVVTLLSSIANGFHTVTLGQNDQVVGTYTTRWGDSATMVLDADASIYTWSDTPITATMQTDTITTGKDGDEVGSVTWTAGPNTVTVPLVLRGNITPPDQWWRLTHPGELGDEPINP